MNPDGPSESATKRDGAFSYAAESHAFTHGAYKGFVAGKPQPTPPESKDSKKELHYYRGGYVLGYIAKILALAGVGFVGYGGP